MAAMREPAEPADSPPGRPRGSCAAPAAAPPYADLTPDAVLNAIDAIGRPAGLATTGTLLTLNSYENRVFQVGVEDAEGKAGFVVAKFYRPGRWTDAQIAEEHAFVAELVAAEVPAVPARTIEGRTLHHLDGHRVALFDRRGGRAPNLDDDEVLEWIGRFIGRIHVLGAPQPYTRRPALDIDSFGVEPREWVLAHGWVPIDLRATYASVSLQALDGVRAAFARAGDVAALRLHGDVHEGNVLWRDAADASAQKDAGPHFVDFDDSRMGPAVQDLWMLMGSREQAPQRLKALLVGYEQFREFDDRELHLVEALRTLRLIHYTAWIARRWNDPAFPAAFPWFDTPRYWEARILELREQIAAMEEPPVHA
jgi:Ser/Thr protein kinase RdoA (MazF antagonist)